MVWKKNLVHLNLVDTSKHDLTKGTIITKVILHARGLRLREKALYRFLSEVVVYEVLCTFLPHVYAAFA